MQSSMLSEASHIFAHSFFFGGTRQLGARKTKKLNLIKLKAKVLNFVKRTKSKSVMVAFLFEVVKSVRSIKDQLLTN